MSEIAKAYVQIIPSAEGIKGSIEKTLGDEGKSAGKSTGGKFASAAGSVISTGLKATATMVTAATGAIAGVAAKALSSYADYEQLAGGTELLFGAASDSVMQKASEAYATVGLSASDYLAQVNGLSTGLKTALGGDEAAAAALADKVVTAEADVVAATGASQEAVQNAFNGIMKSNYTMLDNLQLGITPTKEGMQEVIDKVNEWNAANGNATAYEIDNLADVQSALVDYIDMQGLAGYAAEEASGTITGSITSLKAAWSNLITGMADENADMGSLIDNVLTSAMAAFEQLEPRIITALSGIGTLVAEAAPKVIGMITQILPTLIPALSGAVSSMISAISTALPGIIAIVTGLLPDIIAAGMELLSGLAQGLLQNLPAIANSAVQIIMMLAQYLIENVDQLIQGGIQLITSLAGALSANSAQVATTATDLIIALVNGIINNLPEILGAGLDIVIALAEGIIASVLTLVAAAADLLEQFVEACKDGSAADAGRQIVDDIIAGIKEKWDNLVSWFNGLWDSLFGGRNVNVNVNDNSSGGGVDGSHAGGLDYVPYNGYIAELHQGERVLTAAENRAYSNGSGGVNINITAQQLSKSDIDYIIETANRRLGAIA